jgi:hypothetical protein
MGHSSELRWLLNTETGSFCGFGMLFQKIGAGCG